MTLSKEEKKQLALGKQFANLIEYGATGRKSMLVNSFLRGLAQGFGAVIGGTILVAILVWVLGLFTQVPLISHTSDVISRSINK